MLDTLTALLGILAERFHNHMFNLGRDLAKLFTQRWWWCEHVLCTQLGEGTVEGTISGQPISSQVPDAGGYIDTDPTGYDIHTSDLVMVAGTHVFDTVHHLDKVKYIDRTGPHT